MTTDLENRLFELKLKMNKAKQLNNQAVIEEKKRLADPKWYQKQQSKSTGIGTDHEPSGTLLYETAESIALRSRKSRKSEETGWNVYNDEALYKAQERRIEKMGFYPDAYERQKSQMGDASFYNPGAIGHKPSDDAKERLAGSLKEEVERRKKFSRRRVFDEDEEVQWINEANRRFTKQLDRAFGDYTREIKNNLERGTAV
jgi:hypothetical protein